MTLVLRVGGFGPYVRSVVLEIEAATVIVHLRWELEVGACFGDTKLWAPSAGSPRVPSQAPRAG